MTVSDAYQNALQEARKPIWARRYRSDTIRRAAQQTGIACLREGTIEAKARFEECYRSVMDDLDREIDLKFQEIYAILGEQ